MNHPTRVTSMLLAVTGLTFLSAAPAAGGVLITEIMYNPDSHEGGVGQNAEPNQTEWLEIYNTGDEPIAIGGWYLQDEDGKTVGLPTDATIAPGEAVVLIPGTQTAEDFREAWETEDTQGFQVFALAGWAVGDDPMSNLANGPSDTNEVLTLRNADGEVVDEVNYDDEGPWPSDSPDGPSIALRPDQLHPEANDEGSAWARSEAGTRGAWQNKKTDDYNGTDTGSPGVVAAE
ncbi:MAG: lamin tail domain-containing protein [Phycisphaerales bacterium JB063]